MMHGAGRPLRRRRAAWALAVALAALGAPADAQERRVRDDLDDIFDDIFFVWSAPFNASTRDLEGLAAVGGLVGGGMLVDGQVQRWLDAHPTSLPVKLVGPFREDRPLNHLGRTHFLVPTSTLLWLAGAALGEDGMRDAGLGCIASDIATTLSRFSFSYVVGRKRPRYADDPYEFRVPAFGGFDERSFPGGHAANIMSCVSFWSHRFDLGVAEPLLYALASLVGFGRTVDGAHWTSDTLLGMSWGFAVGKAVAGESRNRENRREDGLRMQPHLQWSIRF
jgi:membrane-associated phospholipid phosphatase